MEVVKDICDRVAIIENGQIIEMNEVEELFKNPKTHTANTFISGLKSHTTDEKFAPDEFNGTLIRLSFLGGKVPRNPLCLK